MQQDQEITEKKPEKKTSDILKRTLSESVRLLFLLITGAASAWLLYKSFPNQSYHALAWFALAPFAWGVSKTRGFWSACVYGWLISFAFHAAALYWIYYTCVNGGGMTVGLSRVAWLGLSGLLALQFAFWSGCCHFLVKLRGFFPLMAAIGWVALEWAHQMIAYYGLGFPWLMLGYTQWNAPEMIQLAGYMGTYGISFLIVWVGTSIGWAFAELGLKKSIGHMFFAACLFLGIYFFGTYQLPQMQNTQRSQSLLSLKAALLQPNIDQYKKWSQEYEEEIVGNLEAMADGLNDKNIRLAVWPESVLPRPLTEEPYEEIVKKIAAQTGAYQLLGSSILQDNKQYVGAYLVAPNETLARQHYQKIKLVPFGEYIPFEKYIRKWFSNVEVLGELGVFEKGKEDQPLLDMEGVKIGTTVCYESIFPQLWQAQNKMGAQLFVNITNDAWFFKTAAPYQHLAANVLRAVETGRPVLRAANTGFSAYIDPFGRIEDKSGLFTRETLIESVPLSLKQAPNFYTQWGDWFAWFCAFIFFTVLISTVVFVYE